MLAIVMFLLAAIVFGAVCLWPLASVVRYGPIEVDALFAARHRGMTVAFCPVNHEPLAMLADAEELAEFVAREWPGRHLTIVKL